jgi:hypothetical protein
MTVKTGLQDATKNVRIYGTISAASSPSSALTPPHCLPTRLANRSPVPLFPLLTYPRLRIFFSAFPYRLVPRRTRVVLTSSPRSVPRSRLPPFLDRRSAPLYASRGGPTTGAPSGAILPAPTAAGTTLMLH